MSTERREREEGDFPVQKRRPSNLCSIKKKKKLSCPFVKPEEINKSGQIFIPRFIFSLVRGQLRACVSKIKHWRAEGCPDT